MTKQSNHSNHWSPGEDRLIREMYSLSGPLWGKMTKQLPGRTANSVRNRYHRILYNEKRLEEGAHSQRKCHSCGQIKFGHTCSLSMAKIAPPSSTAAPSTRRSILKTHFRYSAPTWQRVHLKMKGCVVNDRISPTKPIAETRGVFGSYLTTQEVSQNVPQEVRHHSPHIERSKKRPPAASKPTKVTHTVENVLKRTKTIATKTPPADLFTADETRAIRRYECVRGWYDKYGKHFEECCCSSLWLEFIECAAFGFLDPTNHYGMRPQLDMHDVEAYVDCQPSGELVEFVELLMSNDDFQQEVNRMYIKPCSFVDQPTFVADPL